MKYFSNRNISKFVTLLISRYISSVYRHVSQVKTSLIAKLAASCFTTVKKDYAIMNARLTIT